MGEIILLHVGMFLLCMVVTFLAVTMMLRGAKHD